MFGLGNSLRDLQNNHRINSKSENRASGMEYESDWTKHKKSSVFTAEIIGSATAFMPWSSKIPIGFGYHEFL